MATPPALAQPESIRADELLRMLQDAYSAGPIAETLLVQVRGTGATDDGAKPEGQPTTNETGSAAPTALRQSSIVMRLDASGAEPVVHLTLGQLIIASGAGDAAGRLVAVHTENPDIAWVSEPIAGDAGKVSPGIRTDKSADASAGRAHAGVLSVLERVFPQVPMPQLAWGLQGAQRRLGAGDRVRQSWWWGVGGPGDAQLPEQVRVVVTGDATIEVRSMDASRHLTLRAAGNQTRLASIAVVASAGAQDAPGGTIITVSGIDAGDSSSWRIDPKGRRLVESVSELRPKARDVRVGDVLPAMGLVTARLDGWSLAQALERLAKQSPQPSGPVFGAILVRTRAQADTAQRVRAGAAVRSLERELNVQRLQGAQGVPRLLGIEAVIVEPAELTPSLAAELTRLPQGAGAETAPESLVATAGIAAWERIAPGASIAVVVVDQAQRITGVLPLDSTIVDERALREQLRVLVSTQQGVGPVSGAAPGDAQPASGPR